MFVALESGLLWKSIRVTSMTGTLLITYKYYVEHD